VAPQLGGAGLVARDAQAEAAALGEVEASAALPRRARALEQRRRLHRILLAGALGAQRVAHRDRRARALIAQPARLLRKRVGAPLVPGHAAPELEGRRRLRAAAAIAERTARLEVLERTTLACLVAAREARAELAALLLRLAPRGQHRGPRVAVDQHRGISSAAAAERERIREIGGRARSREGPRPDRVLRAREEPHVIQLRALDLDATDMARWLDREAHHEPPREPRPSQQRLLVACAHVAHARPRRARDEIARERTGRVVRGDRPRAQPERGGDHQDRGPHAGSDRRFGPRA
jgi:hypothetical protein